MTYLNNDTITWFLSIARFFIYPSYFLLDQLLCLFFPTNEETTRGGIPLKSKLIFVPIFCVLLILTIPLFIVFFPLRCLILIIRDPFVLSVKYTPYTKDKAGKFKIKENEFTIATCNLCLLPEYLSRFNHMKDTKERSRKIGERIVIDQLFPNGDNEVVTTQHINTSSGDKATKEDCGVGSVENEKVGEIHTHFNSLDFVMIQEAWTIPKYRALLQELHKIFPFIVHDVGFHSFSSNRFLLGSGLMIASRHTIIAVDFKPFVNFCKHGALISAGLLMVQVELGPDMGEGRRVGYLFNTHLQSYQGDEEVIPKQLDEILEYSDNFIKCTRRSKDNVQFNILSGDFNCDNMSPGDYASQRHKLFDLYEDFGRESPGKDKEWTVGTELRQLFMHESMFRTPEGMKIALQDPRHRRRLVIDADIKTHTVESLVKRDLPCDEHGNVLESFSGGRRRIDLINFHKDHPLKVKEYNLVTRLASLTDHIPVEMSFRCQD